MQCCSAILSFSISALMVLSMKVLHESRSPQSLINWSPCRSTIFTYPINSTIVSAVLGSLFCHSNPPFHADFRLPTDFVLYNLTYNYILYINLLFLN